MSLMLRYSTPKTRQHNLAARLPYSEFKKMFMSIDNLCNSKDDMLKKITNTELTDGSPSKEDENPNKFEVRRRSR